MELTRYEFKWKRSYLPNRLVRNGPGSGSGSGGGLGGVMWGGVLRVYVGW